MASTRGAMVIAERQLHGLLDSALERVRLPASYGVVLEGSIAEGFGNQASDVDFLVVVDCDERFAATPNVTLLAGRKVDVRFRSTLEVREDVDRVLRRHRTARPVPSHTLDRCQRLHGAKTLRSGEPIEVARRILRAVPFEEVVSAHFAKRASVAAKTAQAMLMLDRARLAVSWMHRAAIDAVKSWLAAHGETYLEPRWISHQLSRLGQATQLDLVQRLLGAHAASSDRPEEYVAQALDLIAQLGVDVDEMVASDLTIARCRGVTTWRIRSTTHVLRGRSEVFVLGRAADLVWRRLVFGRSLPDVLAGVDLDGTEARSIVAQFVKLGLVGLRWRRGAVIGDACREGSSPSWGGPLISAEGGVHALGGQAVALLPISADRFAASGLSLAWGSAMVANARADLAGALADEQWGVFDVALRRVVVRVCLLALGVCGVYPLPAPEQASESLRSHDGGERRALLSLLSRVERGLAIRDANRAEAVLSELDRAIEELAATIGSTTLIAAAWSEAALSDTVADLYDWVRIGAYLKVPMPRDDLEQLLASGHRSV
jgi:predicted nucleotidyltransferase